MLILQAKSHHKWYLEKFESNYDKFSSQTDILINAAYWDPKSPKLFEEKDINENFRVKIIA